MSIHILEPEGLTPPTGIEEGFFVAPSIVFLAPSRYRLLSLPAPSQHHLLSLCAPVVQTQYMERFCGADTIYVAISLYS